MRTNQAIIGVVSEPNEKFVSAELSKPRMLGRINHW